MVDTAEPQFEAWPNTSVLTPPRWRGQAGTRIRRRYA